MATAGAWLKTPGLSGTSWPIDYPAIADGQSLLIFVGGYTGDASLLPSLPGAIQVFSGSYPDYAISGALFQVNGTRPAGRLTVTWPSPGCVGSAHCASITGKLDTASAAQPDSSANTDTRTLAALAAQSNDSVRLEILVMAMHRELSASGMTVSMDSSYHTGATGGTGVGVGYKPVGAGATSGSPWVWTSSDYPGATGPDVGSPSVGWAVIYGPDDSPVGPVITGVIAAPDEDSEPLPATPPTAPTVSVNSSTTVSVSMTGYDATATTLTVAMRQIVDGAPGPIVERPAISVTGPSMTATVDGLVPGATYVFFFYISKSGVNSPFYSPDSAPMTLPRAAVHLFTDPSAAGVTGVDVQVFQLPVEGSQWISGERLFARTGMAFDSALQSGRARMVIPVSDGASVPGIGQHVCAVARKKLPDGREIWTRIVSDAVVAEQ